MSIETPEGVYPGCTALSGLGEVGKVIVVQVPGRTGTVRAIVSSPVRSPNDLVLTIDGAGQARVFGVGSVQTQARTTDFLRTSRRSKPLPPPLYWEFIQKDGATWETLERNRFRIGYENSANCGGANALAQSGVAVGFLTTDRRLTLRFAGRGRTEAQDSGYEILTIAVVPVAKVVPTYPGIDSVEHIYGFAAYEDLLASAGNVPLTGDLVLKLGSFGRKLGCQMDLVSFQLDDSGSLLVLPRNEHVLAQPSGGSTPLRYTCTPGKYFIVLSSSTIDGRFHSDAFWDVQMFIEG